MNHLVSWFHAKDWRTWVSHILMAAVLGTVATFLFDVPVEKGMLMGVLAYWWREAEQVFEEARKQGMDVVHSHALDHMLDAAAPFVALILWGVLK
jgi:hypothetical protein